LSAEVPESYSEQQLLHGVEAGGEHNKKTTRRASSTTSAAKGRLGTTWGRC